MGKGCGEWAGKQQVADFISTILPTPLSDPRGLRPAANRMLDHLPSYKCAQFVASAG